MTNQNKAKAIKTAAKKANFTKFEILNVGVPDKIREAVDLKTIRTPFIPFGEDNLFPQFLAEVKSQT